MPTRGSSKQALASRFRVAGCDAGGSTNHPPPTDAQDKPSSDSVSDNNDLDILGDRITAIVLNDEGPNMKTGYNPEPEPPAHVDLQDPPTEIQVEDILPEIQNILTNPARRRLPSSAAPLTPIERKRLKKERSQHTVRVLSIFDRMDKQITTLSEQLALFKEQPSSIAFTAIKSKFEALQKGLEKNTRNTASLDAKRDQLVVRLTSLNDRIQEVRALLAAEEEGPRQVSNGELCGIFLRSFDLISSS
jgi:hypothetical protein